jgi:hypothetical protein
VQVFESGAFVNLATVVAPVGAARAGTPVLRARMLSDTGGESRSEVKAGSLEVMSLAPGETGRLQLQPLHRTDIGWGPGRSGSVQVSGGLLGVVLDGRGRPLELPADGGKRRELLKKWLWTVGG